MKVIWGAVVVLLSVLAWGGQALSWFSPSAAVRWKVMEAEHDVEPAFWADVRAEALWDTFTLWTMIVAGVLLMLDIGTWTYFGLVGGGMFLYFGGRSILTRVAMTRRGLRIGAPTNISLGYLFSAIWAAMALTTIIVAIFELEG